MGTGGDSFVIGKQTRASGGIIIKANGSQFHIDPGPGALAAAKQCNINIRENTAVLVSNNSLYNCNDINAVIDAMTYSGFDKKGVLISNNTTVNGSETEKPYLLESYKHMIERFIVLAAGQKVGINDVDIAALKTKNKDPNAIGFKLYTPNFTLSYTSDTKYAASLAEEYKDSDILIINMPYISKKDSNEGLCKEDVIKLINAVNPKLAVLTHFGAEMLKADPLYEIREIQRSIKSQIVAAKDGMTLSPGSYHFGQRQKKLKVFSNGLEQAGVKVYDVKGGEAVQEEKPEEQKKLDVS